MAKAKDPKESSDKKEVNLNLDPYKAPVMLADTYVISSNEHVVTFNFAQAFLDSTQQHVVARVALTRAQAKEFLKNLSDYVDRFEV